MRSFCKKHLQIFNQLFVKRKNNSGIILLIVLWALVILTVLAVSIGRNSSVELSLTKYAVGKLKSKYIAHGAIAYAMDLISQDSADVNSRIVDNLNFCAVPVNIEESLEDLFKGVPVEGGYFDIRYFSEGQDAGAVVSTEIGETYSENQSGELYRETSGGENLRLFYGMQDEERKINLNALRQKEAEILIELIKALGFEEEAANVITYSIIDWKDTDSTLSHEQHGAENDYYEGLINGYLPKNSAFQSKEELLLVRGMTNEIYDKLSRYVTVSINESKLKINFDTATETVLLALARSAAGSSTNTDLSDADSLVGKILEFRRGEDGIEPSVDDRKVELNDMVLVGNERTIFLVLNQYRARTSSYLNIQVRGVDTDRNTETRIEAIVDREDMSIVYWHRQ